MHFSHGLFAGSFDPVTEGHLDIIRRACSVCDRVTVGVFVNPNKSCLFSMEERVAKLREATKDMPFVDVVCSTGYTYLYAKELGCDVLLRGYRNKTDLFYEFEIAVFNFTHGRLPTHLFPASPSLKNVSSGAVRESLKTAQNP